MTLAGVELEEMGARQMTGVLLATFAEGAANLDVALEALTPAPALAAVPDEPLDPEALRETWGLTKPVPLKDRMIGDS